MLCPGSCGGASGTERPQVVGQKHRPCVRSENSHAPPTLKSDTVGAEARMGKAISSSQTGRGGALPTTSLVLAREGCRGPASSSALQPGSGREHA